jgi:hypothetical protein
MNHRGGKIGMPVSFMRRWLVIAMCGLLAMTASGLGDESKSDLSSDAGEHTIESALELMGVCRERLASVFDYRCRIVREMVQGPNSSHVEEIVAKFRHHPASVYFGWLSPVKGQELIWVAGANGGRVMSHGSRAPHGPSELDRASPLVVSNLPADGAEALGLGVGATLERITSRWEEERKLHRSAAVAIESAKVNGRSCYVVRVCYPYADDGTFRFHTTRVYVDKEHLLPTRAEEFGYPDEPGLEPGRLLESWTILDLRINPGLKSEDFSISNTEYHFSRF